MSPAHDSAHLFWVLLKLPPATPPPACAVFRDQQAAEAIAEDPWAAAGWCTSNDFRVEPSRVHGDYVSGEAVYAAHSPTDDERLGRWRFVGLYATWADAEKAAGDLGLTNELHPR